MRKYRRWPTGTTRAEINRAWHRQRRALGLCQKCGCKVTETNTITGVEYNCCRQCRYKRSDRRRDERLGL